MEGNILELLEQRIAACAGERKRLQEEDCNDEADFEKIKENVYDIFRTVFLAAGKRHGDDPAKIYGFFAEKLEQIPLGWHRAYEEAKAHDDVKTMHIESIKLDVARDIKENIFAGNCEGTEQSPVFQEGRKDL